MCGICGIAVFDKAKPLANTLKQMNYAIRHRGPDDEGFALVRKTDTPLFFSGLSSPQIIKDTIPNIESGLNVESMIGVAHRRFSIIDPTPDAHQPWFDKAGGNILSFNGEIYNYIELRHELENLGSGPFLTNSDTEVVARAYSVWGEACFEKFNGFWAIAIVDLKRRLLILSRDRIGKKPLYLFRPDSNTLLFSSEIRSIMKGAKGGPHSFKVDNDAMLLYLLYDRRNTIKGCMWQEIELLPPAVIRKISLDTGKYTDNCFWQLRNDRYSKSDISFQDAQDEFLKLFNTAVKVRLRADVPVCANLSGGLDSSSIVATAQRSLGLKKILETNTVRHYNAPKIDEGDFAKIVANYVGCKHQDNFISSDECWSHFDFLVEAFEEPVHSMVFITQWMGWTAMAKLGFKVLLNGSGNDEIMAGYPYLTDIEDYEALNRLDLKRYFSARPPWVFRQQLRLVKHFLNGQVFPGVSNPLRHIWGGVDRRKHHVNYEPDVFSRFFNHEFLNKTDDFHREFDSMFFSANQSISTRMANDVTCLRIPFWVNAMDKCMMEIPVEVRYPFLDYKLIDFLFKLPVDYLYSQGWTKYILRKSMDNMLPSSILWKKKKMGFVAPQEKWLKAQQNRVENLLSNNREKLGKFVQVDSILSNLLDVPEDMLWRIVNIAKWLEIFEPKCE